VSAHGRDIGSGPYDDFLQIDAAVNRGNSGGPTFNTQGRVVGVNTAIFSTSGGSIGIAFNIPASTAKLVVAQLRAHGHVRRGWLGVRVQSVTGPIAESLGIGKAKGALIADVEADSPAAKAGLSPGDVITSVNGFELEGPRHLARLVASMAPNSDAAIGYLRNGTANTLNTTIEQQREKKEPSAKATSADGPANKLGLTLAPAADVDGAGAEGLAVLRVNPESKASELGLAAGDVILRVGPVVVNTAEGFNRAFDSARGSGRRSVLVLVKRDSSRRFIAVPTSTG
jgi:serine protease Do